MEPSFIIKPEDPLMQMFMKYICHQTGITYAQDRNALDSISALELFGCFPKNEVTRGWLLSHVRM